MENDQNYYFLKNATENPTLISEDLSGVDVKHGAMTDHMQMSTPSLETSSNKRLKIIQTFNNNSNPDSNQ